MRLCEHRRSYRQYTRIDTPRPRQKFAESSPLDLMDFEEFQTELAGALVHLSDPDYQPSEALCSVVGCEHAAGAATFQLAIEPVKPLNSTTNGMPTTLLRSPDELQPT